MRQIVYFFWDNGEKRDDNNPVDNRNDNGSASDTNTLDIVDNSASETDIANIADNSASETDIANISVGNSANEASNVIHNNSDDNTLVDRFGIDTYEDPNDESFSSAVSFDGQHEGNQSDFYSTDRVLRDRNQLPKRNYKERDSMDFNSTLMVAECLEPNSFLEATRCTDSKEWIAAMDDEMNSLIENETWTLTKLPEGRKVVSIVGYIG